MIVAAVIVPVVLIHFGLVIAEEWPAPPPLALTDRQVMVLERARRIVAAWHRLVIG